MTIVKPKHGRSMQTIFTRNCYTVKVNKLAKNVWLFFCKWISKSFTETIRNTIKATRKKLCLKLAQGILSRFRIWYFALFVGSQFRLNTLSIAYGNFQNDNISSHIKVGTDMSPSLNLVRPFSSDSSYNALFSKWIKHI